ncbi:MAG: aminotransferase class I/II-fold pyridoxal phosphate-dependent enzyme [Anaerolineae bacterium]|nr:aminotransferase class I/II-fold pyridoxal phosphate-dependent enzyme [Anaerolineae bacterium]
MSQSALFSRYDAFRAQKLNIDMTRGKPCNAQLDLAADLMTCVTNADAMVADGVDIRNYGAMDGIAEAKMLFADYLEVATDEIIIGSNSSLSLMYDTLARAMLFGVPDSAVAWGKLPEVKFLCPVPGYDRHFSICENFGIKMIPIAMNSDGPDMDQIERLVAEDEAIKGMWSVPKYSNPSGITYSPDVVARLAQMRCKAADFRIIWDNAYTVHHLSDTPDHLANLLAACKSAGNAERPIIIGSTAKVSLAGSSVAMIGGSKRNIDAMKKQMGIQTIGADKVNQLRHVRFFKNMAGIEAHMRKHAAILRPKFDAVQDVLGRELGGLNIATWSKPNGGYFVSLDTLPGKAKRVIEMAAAVGVNLTPAGSTTPYKRDPADTNIRIAPSFPSIPDIRTAMEVMSVCIQLA